MRGTCLQRSRKGSLGLEHPGIWWRRRRSRRDQILHLQYLQQQAQEKIRHAHHTPYIVETKKVSKEVISWMSSKLTTLLNILPVISKDIRKVLLDTISNQIMLWDLAGENALTHFGKVLSTEERNWLMHTLNGNILGCIRAREHNSAEWNDSNWEHVQLHHQERWQACRQTSPYLRENPQRSRRLMDLPLSNFNVEELEEASWKEHKAGFTCWKRTVKKDAHHQWSIPGMEKKTCHGYTWKHGKITSITPDFKMHGHYHQYHLPAPVDDADKTILDNKVGHGYLDLFCEDTMDWYNWPWYDKLSNSNKTFGTTKSGSTLVNTVEDDYGIYPKPTEEIATGQHLTNGQRIIKSMLTTL